MPGKQAGNVNSKTLLARMEWTTHCSKAHSSREARHCACLSTSESASLSRVLPRHSTAASLLLSHEQQPRRPEHSSSAVADRFHRPAQYAGGSAHTHSRSVCRTPSCKRATGKSIHTTKKETPRCCFVLNSVRPTCRPLPLLYAVYAFSPV